MWIYVGNTALQCDSWAGKVFIQTQYLKVVSTGSSNENKSDRTLWKHENLESRLTKDHIREIFVVTDLVTGKKFRVDLQIDCSNFYREIDWII